MSSDWKGALLRLLEIASKNAYSPQQGQQASNTPPIAINLGIDFGTSFTKVCFRDVGAEQTGIIGFEGRSLKSALIPSVVAIDPQGRLRIENRLDRSDTHILVPYLKMRLAGVPLEAGLPHVLGISLDNHDVCCAMSSWFLATVIQRCQEWVKDHEGERVRNRRIIWSANIGVPVEHYDSEAITTFNEVLDVAWKWSKIGEVPKDLKSAVETYHVTRITAGPEPNDCHAIPEIAAAVQSFIMSREAVAGIYVYFDIGAGTNDGVVFNFINDDGERRVNFYYGKVAPLGIAALFNHFGVKAPGAVDTEILQRLLSKSADGVRSDFATKIQLHVAGVIMEGKKKDGRNWQIAAIQNPNIERKRIGFLEESQMKPLVVFIGGGGSEVPWYRESIAATYREFNHQRADIPPYKLIDVPKPNDLDMTGLRSEEYKRFAIAYGLSIPFGEGPEIGLPSRFKNSEPLPDWKPRDVVDYRDSKDAYD